MSDALEEEAFYELMQTYRHWPIAHDSNGVVEAFEEVKAYVRRHFVEAKRDADPR
jgi:hypothetical protein